MKRRPPFVRAESLCIEYVTIADFSDAVGDGISFLAGQSVKVRLYKYSVFEFHALCMTKCCSSNMIPLF